MILQAVAVFDTVAQYFSQPFFVKSLGEAERSFVDACSDQRSAIGAHPEDYKLMHVGEFDDVSGVLTSKVPVLIRSGFKVVSTDVQQV